MMERSGPGQRRRRSSRVACTIVLATLALRVIVAPSQLLPSLLSAAVDGFILGGFILALAAVPRRSGPAGRAASVLTAAPLLVYGSLLFWHAWFLDIGGEYRFSLIGVTAGNVLFFSRQIVPAHAWAAFGAFWALVLWSRRWVVYDRVLPSRLSALPGYARFALGVSLLALGIGATTLPAAQHPLRASLRDAAGDSRSRVIRASGERLPVAHLDLRRTDTWPVPSRFRRVLVFVMEGVSRQDFEAKLPQLPADGFFHGVESFATRYNGYYTVNQESRTARMAMLHSLMIPYEAYVSNWMDVFGYIYDHGGLVDLLNANGWRTTLAIPLVDAPWDLRGLPWKARIGIGDGDMDRTDFTCLAPTQYDRGCEDRILLARIDSLLAGPGPLFLFQPFLFGHTNKWEETTGTDRIAYYDRYLKDVLAALRARDALAGTLIVATSDHGPRFYDDVSRTGSYEVPLWLVHPSFPAEVRSGFFASTEFRDLLLETMRAAAPPAARRRPYVMAMGPSTRGLFMCAMEDGRSGFFRIAGEGQATVLRASTDDAGFLTSCVSTFFGYRSRFDAAGRG